MNLGHLQARQNLNVPSDFSYGGVANELITNIRGNFASNIGNAANVPSPSFVLKQTWTKSSVRYVYSDDCNTSFSITRIFNSAVYCASKHKRCFS
jgi:hypothetical protein